MGEVDQLDDAVNHRVAQRDERKDGALGQAEHKGLSEVGCIPDRLGQEEDDGSCAQDVKAVVGKTHAAQRDGAESRQG